MVLHRPFELARQIGNMGTGTRHCESHGSPLLIATEGQLLMREAFSLEQNGVAELEARGNIEQG